MVYGVASFLALEETGASSESSLETKTDEAGTEDSISVDGAGDSSVGGSSDGVSDTAESSDVVVHLPTPYETVSLDGGELRVVQEVTYGDILVCFCILLAVAVQIGKWIWESVK